MIKLFKETRFFLQTDMRWTGIPFTFLWFSLTVYVVRTESSLCSEGADVAFILDSSGSLGRTNYERQKIFVKDTMKKLAEKCNLLNGAVVLYSTTARVGINFSHSFNLEFFNVQIDKLPWYAGYTRIDKGLRVAANDVFTTRTGSRPDAPKVAILTTDGSLTRRPDTVPLANASEPLKQKGVRIFAIGVGRNVALDELFQITERMEDVFLFNTFSSLIREVDSLVPKILKAIDNPSIQLSEDATSLFAGRNYSFECMTTGWPVPTVTWLMNGKELKDGDMNQTIALEKNSEGDQFNLSLHILDVDLRHAGNYTCEATNNKYRSKRRNVLVTVSCPPVLPVVAALPPVMGTNNNVTLSCLFYRLDHHRINSYIWQWKFQDKDLKEDGRYKIFSEYSPPNSCEQSKGLVAFQIGNVSKHDFGQYMCSLQMSGVTLAEKGISFYELVNSKVPSRPNIVKLITINCGRTIKVEWNPSSGIRVTGYQIELIPLAEDSKQVFNLSSELQSIQLDVKSNTDYDVNIRAKNSAGFSLWSKRQMTTTADIPEAFNVIAKPDGCYLKLSWKTPSANSCPITRYTVHYREFATSASNNRMWHIKSLNESNRTDYRLQLNCSTKYAVMVMAWNRRGSSYPDGKMVFVRTDKGVPFKPLLSEPKENQCGEYEVTWDQASIDSGGGPVTGFQVQIGDVDDWSNCTSFLANQSCLFKGLKSEKGYDIRVQALNQKGASGWTYKAIHTGRIGRPGPPRIRNNETELPGRNVTVLWSRPPENNCNITMYSLRYRVVKPTTEQWEEVNITDANITSYELHLQYSKKYSVKVSAWNDLGRSVENKTWEVRTAQYLPHEPILHSDLLGSCSSINVTWSPPKREALGGPITGYLAQMKTFSSKDTWINCTAFNNSVSTSCLFIKLKTNTKYDVRVMAKNKLGYGWPSEMVEASTNQADIPDEPEIKDIKEQGCNVTIEWTRPQSNGCPIRFYTIRYKQQKPRQGDKVWAEINVTDPSASQRELMLKCTMTYEFQVVASNEIGRSLPSTVRSATTGGDIIMNTLYEGLSVGSILKIVFAIAGLILVAILLAIGAKYYRRRKQHRTRRTVKDIEVLDSCEITPVRTEFVEALGQGAFGKVHKAKLKDGLEYFNIEQNRVNTIKKQTIVAVKELYESANEEQKREFMDEIELMKEVGKHPNVLSFLGCWTTTQPLLLIIEYIAHGDLLHWLRRKRSQISGSTLGNAVVNPKEKELYAGTRGQLPTADHDQGGEADGKEAGVLCENIGTSTSIDVTEEEEADFNGNSECQIPMVVFSAPKQEEDVPTETTDDECDEDCESFNPADLMTFAWQIARGMSYLSEKGLVHRDLAARNILVGHGKRLKIADFGLMRQMYHEVYEVQKQKRLPLKWMAPESIYEQIFTSKSDVWSYGVVMWEIGTLGGSPYPLISNAELMRLLRTDYRMDKPDLCSDNFYTLMMDCWRKNPDERPSFQELVGRLEQLMLQEVEYFDFNKVDESKDYYQVQESKTAEITGEDKSL